MALGGKTQLSEQRAGKESMRHHTPGKRQKDFPAGSGKLLPSRHYPMVADSLLFCNGSYFDERLPGFFLKKGGEGKNVPGKHIRPCRQLLHVFFWCSVRRNLHGNCPSSKRCRCLSAQRRLHEILSPVFTGVVLPFSKAGLAEMMPFKWYLKGVSGNLLTLPYLHSLFPVGK